MTWMPSSPLSNKLSDLNLKSKSPEIYVLSQPINNIPIQLFVSR